MTAKEFELLSLLVEECGETVQAIGKIFRHGLNDGWNGVSNKEYLEMEIADIMGVIQLILSDKRFLNKDAIYNRIEEKFWNGKINKWLHSFKTDDTINHTFMVEYTIWDGDERHYDKRPVIFKTRDVDYIKRRMEEYFDKNYLENVDILEITPIEEWTVKNTMKV